MHLLLKETHDILTLIMLLLKPTRQLNYLIFKTNVSDEYLLFFVCSLPKSLAPPKGYPVRVTKELIVRMAPVLQVGLVV